MLRVVERIARSRSRLKGEEEERRRQHSKGVGCQDRKKMVSGQMGTDTHRSREYREQKVIATSASFCNQ